MNIKVMTTKCSYVLRKRETWKVDVYVYICLEMFNSWTKKNVKYIYIFDNI